MSAKSTKMRSTRSRTDWKQLRKASDTDIRYTDIPKTNARFWAEAKVLMPPAKTHLSLRLDEDIVEWFKRQGPGYQTKMNAVLRSFVEAQTGKQR